MPTFVTAVLHSAREMGIACGSGAIDVDFHVQRSSRISDKVLMIAEGRLR